MSSTLVRTRLRMAAIVALAAFSLSLLPQVIVRSFFVPQTTFGIDIDDRTLLVAVNDPRAAKAGLHDGDRLDVTRLSYDDRVKLFVGQNYPWNWALGTTVAVSVSSPRFGSRISGAANI